MTDKEKNEMVFDALLKIAVKEAFEREMAGPHSEEESGMTDKPSPELDRKIRRLVGRIRRKSKMRRYAKRLGKAAACVCAVLALFSGILLSVGATRNAIFNAIIELREKYTQIRFESSEEAEGLYRPAYLPEGFAETSCVKFGSAVMLTYSNEDGVEIVFNQSPAGSGTTLVDSENTSYAEVEVSDVTAYLFKAQSEDDANTLIWQSDGVVFELSSRIDSGELIKIGESIRKA